MIKHLIFDFGNVLLKSDFEGYLCRIIADEKVRAALRALLFTRQFTEQLDLGYIPSEQLFAALAEEHPHLAGSIKLFQDRWIEHLDGEMPGMRALLEKYKQAGFGLYGLSNWSDMIYPVMEQYPIFGLLDGSIISSEEHMIKPHHEIYQCLFDRYNLHPSECLFVDDKAENVAAGQALGMQGIVFKDANQLDREIRRFLPISSPKILH